MTDHILPETRRVNMLKKSFPSVRLWYAFSLCIKFSLCLCMYIILHMHTPRKVYVSACVCLYILVCLYRYIYIYTHAYTHTKWWDRGVLLMLHYMLFSSFSHPLKDILDLSPWRQKPVILCCPSTTSMVDPVFSTSPVCNLSRTSLFRS